MVENVFNGWWRAELSYLRLGYEPRAISRRVPLYYRLSSRKKWGGGKTTEASKQQTTESVALRFTS